MARTRTRSGERGFRRLALVAGAAVAAATAAGVARPVGGGLHVDGPPLAHTGGFGEPTCRVCHFDRPPDEAGGSLALEGLPEERFAGEPVGIEVVLKRPGLVRAGFQLSARFAGGALAGRQAGLFRATDVRVTVREDTLTGVQYAQHARVGTRGFPPGEARWRVMWEAPAAEVPVTFHLAGNATNDDDSEFGDAIYARDYTIGSARSER